MKYIKYFETIEEYQTWMRIEENAEEVYKSEEKMCVDGVIISHTYKDFENPIAIGDTQWFTNG